MQIKGKWKLATLAFCVAAIGGVDAVSADSTELPIAQPRPGFASGGTLTRFFGWTPEGPILGGARDILIPTTEGREPINEANSPARLHPSLRGRMLRLGVGPEAGEVDRDVFPSAWWPQVENGIAARWNSTNRDYGDWESDQSNLSPAEKYDLLFFPGQPQAIPEVRNSTIAELNRSNSERNTPLIQPAITVIGPTTAWELMNHGVYQRVYPESWYGHCNGWSSFVTAERGAAPLHDVRVRNRDGQLVECSEQERDCVLFRMADIEALLWEVYFHDSSTMSGSRCDTDPTKIERDEFGRPVEPVCRDVNPATFHVALTGLLGQGASPLSNLRAARERLPFNIDYAWNNEVWTFPVVKYNFDEVEPIDASRAAKLVCGGAAPPPNCRNYPFNANAVRFARVKTRFWVMAYAADSRALLTPPLQRERPLRETTVHYVLELDGRGTILGGEWIAAPNTTGPGSRELHPDFLFMSVSPNASNESADDRGGTQDNPYISYTAVKALVRLSRTTPRR